MCDCLATGDVSRREAGSRRRFDLVPKDWFIILSLFCFSSWIRG